MRQACPPVYIVMRRFQLVTGLVLTQHLLTALIGLACKLTLERTLELLTRIYSSAYSYHLV